MFAPSGTTASEQEISPQNEMQKEKLLALMTKIAAECAGFAVEAAPHRKKHQVLSGGHQHLVVKHVVTLIIIDPSEVMIL